MTLEYPRAKVYLMILEYPLPLACISHKYPPRAPQDASLPPLISLPQTISLHLSVTDVQPS